MRIPLNWLADYVSLPKDKDKLTDSLTIAGHMLDKIDHLDNETIIDLELRGNRADCYSILGIAREVSALFNRKAKYPPAAKKLKQIDKLNDLSLDVKSNNVKRVAMIVIKNVKITKSPEWMAKRLKHYGIDPINNIVDLTNYVTIELGEPMHAFDMDRIGKKLQIRMARDGERMTTFQDSTLTLTKDDLVWANNKEVLSVAGAIGSKKHSITSETKNVLLEAASYEQANIRRSVHRHNLFTEAGTRHEKDLDPNLVTPAIYRFLYLIKENSWGQVGKTIFDYYPSPVKPWKLKLDYKHLETLGNIKIPKQKIKDILTDLGFNILKSDPKQIEVLVPTFRTDVTLEEDLIEEVLRIYGYDKIPEKILSLEIPEVITPNYIDQELEYKNILNKIGFDEIISLPFVKEKLLKYNFAPDYKQAKPVSVQNFPSPDTREMRMNFLPNLMDVTQKVINERGKLAQFFEVGKVYYTKGNHYTEKRSLGIAYWQKNGNFKKVKGYIEGFLSQINLQHVEFTPTLDLPKLSQAYYVTSKKDKIGFGGKVKDIYFAEFNLDNILGKTGKTSVKLWPKYPPQIEDITFNLPQKTLIGKVMASIKKTKLVQKVELTDSYKDYFTFRIWYQAKSKTLTNKEVEKIRQKVISSVAKKFGGIVKD